MLLIIGFVSVHSPACTRTWTKGAPLGTIHHVLHDVIFDIQCHTVLYIFLQSAVFEGLS